MEALSSNMKVVAEALRKAGGNYNIDENGIKYYVYDVVKDNMTAYAFAWKEIDGNDYFTPYKATVIVTKLNDEEKKKRHLKANSNYSHEIVYWMQDTDTDKEIEDRARFINASNEDIWGLLDRTIKRLIWVVEDVGFPKIKFIEDDEKLD